MRERYTKSCKRKELKRTNVCMYARSDEHVKHFNNNIVCIVILKHFCKILKCEP